MESIVSRSNALVKKIKKLSERKYREAYGEYIAEGKRWVEDALRLCPQNVSAVIRSEESDGDADFVLSASLFRELSATENNQGIMALMRIPAASDTYDGDYCLYLDRVRDPGNMGAIIRTASAAGYTDIVLSDCVDVYNPKVIRSCMTGVLGVRFHYEHSLAAVKAGGYTAIAAVLDGADVFTTPIAAKKVCLVIGNEADGIAPHIAAACDIAVTIPMRADMESLNAAVSAGILMYQLKYKEKEK